MSAGDAQEDAGCGQHAGAVQHGDETDREASHPGQVHHDRGNAAHLRLHVPSDPIPGLTAAHTHGSVDQSWTFSAAHHP